MIAPGGQGLRILLIKPSAVGDVLHALPVLVRLRHRFPHARIDWLIAPANLPLVAAHPALSHAPIFDRAGMARFPLTLRSWKHLLRLARQLRQPGYDVVIDLQGLLRSALLTHLACAPIRLGFADARESAPAAYSHTAPARQEREHAAMANLRLAAILGTAADPPAPDELAIHIPPADRLAGQQLLAEARLTDRRFVAIAPGTRWETKHWPAEHFATLACGLQQQGWPVALIGPPAEAPTLAAVAGRAPHAVNLVGKTGLAALAHLLANAALLVTNDNGAMHIAAAVQTPVLALFGPTSPHRTGPLASPGRSTVLQRDLPCSPCFLKRIRQCPHHHTCMRELEPAEALTAAINLLRPRPTGP